MHLQYLKANGQLDLAEKIEKLLRDEAADAEVQGISPDHALSLMIACDMTLVEFVLTVSIHITINSLGRIGCHYCHHLVH